jgi:hypothetical protein
MMDTYKTISCYSPLCIFYLNGLCQLHEIKIEGGLCTRYEKKCGSRSISINFKS